MKRILLYVILLMVIACQKNEAPTCIITSPTHNASFNMGDSISISVNADDPDDNLEKVTLFLNETVIQTLRNYPFTYVLRTGQMIPGSYTIKATARDLEGLEATDEVALTIKATLPTVMTTSIDSISNSSVYIGGEVTSDGGVTVSARGFCWNTIRNPTLLNNYITEGTGSGPYISKITNLLCKTEYFVRAYATNSLGTVYGEQLSFVTDNCYSLPTVITRAINTITDSTAKSGGNITYNGGANIRERGVCWSTSPKPTLVNMHTTDGAGGGNFTSLLTGLTCKTRYYVRAYATNVSGTGYGDTISFVSGDCPVNTPSISTAGVTNITSTSAQSGGLISDDGGAPVTDRGICWSHSTEPTLSDSHTSDGSGTGSFTSSLTGLDCDTTYFIRAYATNSVGTAFGSELSFSTSPCPVYLPTITTNLISNNTGTRAESGGNVTDDGGLEVTLRGLCWSKAQDPTTADNHTTDGDGTGTFESVISGLTPETTYYLRTYAVNSLGTGYGNQVEFTTTGAGETVTDIDGNTYRTVQIGNQQWMAENLMVTTYSDGTGIPLVEEFSSWSSLAYNDKGFCWYDNNLSNKYIYGGLYTWPAAMNSQGSSFSNPSGIQGVCPDSWHLPSDSEWKQLEIHLGMNPAETDLVWGRGSDEGGKLKEAGYTHWTSPNTGGSNETGFSALPSGNREDDGNFYGTSVRSNFWTSTETDGAWAWYRWLAYDSASIIRLSYYKERGFAVRCVNDDVVSSVPTITTTSVSAISSSSANSGGKVYQEGGEPVTARGVCWSTSPDPTVDDFKTIDGAGLGDFSGSLTGLSSFQTYYLRAYATNIAGTAYGEELSFRTLWDGSTVSDIDGNVYNTVAIGDRVWMTRNLGVTRYADGSAILLIEDNSQWAELDFSDRAYCFYENLPGNNKNVGVLYTWAAAARSDSSVMNPSGLQGVCPDGWHLPSDEEWKNLEISVGLSQTDADLAGHRGLDEGGKLKEAGNDFWAGDNAGATNETGFSGRGSGVRNFDGTFNYYGLVSVMWSTTNYNDADAWVRGLYYDASRISRIHYTKKHGFSVRCVWD